MKNLFDLFKKPVVETKEEIEQLYKWKMTIVFNDHIEHNLYTFHLTKKEAEVMPKEMKAIINWYENPTAPAIKTFYFDAGSLSIDADNIHHIYANKALE